jgi:uncharacterized protein (TIGR02996 family)
MNARFISLPEPTDGPHTVTLVHRDRGPRVVELVQSERFVARSFGRLGGRLATSHREYANPHVAARALAAALQRLYCRGYLDGAREPEYEAAIARAPEDPTHYLVYADYLSAHGDLRGELITSATMIDQHGEQPELLARERELFAHHPFTFTDPRWFDLQLGWRFGFVEVLRTTFPLDRLVPVGETRTIPYHPDNKPHTWFVPEFGQVLARLRKHPSGRFVRRIESPGGSFVTRRIELVHQPTWTSLRYGWQLTRVR